MFSRVPTEQDPFVQTDIPCWHGPVTDPATGRWISTHVMNQDFVAWVGQGRIADRTAEKLGLSDRGIMMLRQLFLADIEAIKRGDDPKGIVRDPQANICVELPVADRRMLVDGVPLDELRRHPTLGAHLSHFISFRPASPPRFGRTIAGQWA